MIGGIINFNIILKIFNGIPELANSGSLTLFAWLPNLPTDIEARSGCSHEEHDQVCSQIDGSSVSTEVAEEGGETSRAEYF